MNKHLLLIAVSFLVASCNPQKSLQTKIEKLSQEYAGGKVELTNKLASTMAEYAIKYPNDSLSQGYLSLAAQYFSAANDQDEAIHACEKFAELYPNSEAKTEMYLIQARAYSALDKSDSCIKYFERVGASFDYSGTDKHLWKKAYLDYIEKNPNGDQSIDYSIKAANLLAASGSGDQAIILLNKIVEGSPDSKFAPYALMRIADIQENDLSNIEGAEMSLKRLIELYPSSNFANDAKIILEKGLLGLTEEEQFAKIIGKEAS
jgi:outer membrane protein assembly factor BamD (BamD/ComL family)